MIKLQIFITSVHTISLPSFILDIQKSFSSQTHKF